MTFSGVIAPLDTSLKMDQIASLTREIKSSSLLLMDSRQ